MGPGYDDSSSIGSHSIPWIPPCVPQRSCSYSRMLRTKTICNLSKWEFERKKNTFGTPYISRNCQVLWDASHWLFCFSISETPKCSEALTPVDRLGALARGGLSCTTYPDPNGFSLQLLPSLLKLPAVAHIIMMLPKIEMILCGAREAAVLEVCHHDESGCFVVAYRHFSWRQLNKTRVAPQEMLWAVNMPLNVEHNRNQKPDMQRKIHGWEFSKLHLTRESLEHPLSLRNSQVWISFPAATCLGNRQTLTQPPKPKTSKDP